MRVRKRTDRGHIGRTRIIADIILKGCLNVSGLYYGAQ